MIGKDSCQAEAMTPSHSLFALGMVLYQMSKHLVTDARLQTS